MLEVCFSDSVKGSLTLAQNCNNIIGGAVSVLTNSKGVCSYFEKRKALKRYRKRKLELQNQAVSLGGKREDIVGISFGLSEGDIKAPISFEDCPRKDYIHSTFSFDRYDELEGIEQSINDFWSSCIDDLKKLKSNPEKIRIWLDRTPDAQCGLLFVADLLKNSETEIHIVELPEKIQREDNCIVEYRGWGDVESELFGTFLDRERTLTKAEIIKLSQQWEKLKKENSPLRVIEKGVIISADESYYDSYTKQVFFMYDGEMVTVDLRCDNSLMKTIIDRFGEDVKTLAYDMTSFRVLAEVSASPTFFGWVFGFGGKVQILGPENVKEQYQQMVVQASENIKSE